MSMRGLIIFIKEIRQCVVREQEEKRINKELAHIRAKFKEGNLTGYDRKKYVCKLLFCYILGWDISFGHSEAFNLISSSKHSEKQIGYLAVSLLLSENSELTRLVINSLRKDLQDTNEIYNCMALHAIANIGGRDMAETLAKDVENLLVSANSKSFVRKKAALCLLRLVRKYPEIIVPNEWALKMLPLMSHNNLGVCLSVTQLILEITKIYPEEHSESLPLAIDKFHRQMCTVDYIYYKVPIPWLQVALLRLIQVSSAPQDEELCKKLKTVLSSVLSTVQEFPRNFQHSNAQNAVIYEAIVLIIDWDFDNALVTEAAQILSFFISSKETNIRYLGLKLMTKMISKFPTLDELKSHQEKIFQSLRDKDISVRRRALDLLYNMCDYHSAKKIVGELLLYLASADHTIKDELVLKIAVLAEQFTDDKTWFVDTILQLISLAGDYVSDDVWHRVVQIVTNSEQKLQYHAANSCFNALKSLSSHEKTFKTAGYILGEFGHSIIADANCSPLQQFLTVHTRFLISSAETKALLLNTYAKMHNLYPEVRPHVEEVLEMYSHSLNVELQQRACEYLALTKSEIMAEVFDEMPLYPERESTLLARINHKSPHDKKMWSLNREKSVVKIEEPTVVECSPEELAKMGDLLDLSDEFQEKAVIAMPAAPEETALVLANSNLTVLTELSMRASEQHYNKLLLTDSGLLFTYRDIQLFIQSSYQKQYGKMAITLQNISNEPIFGLNAGISAIPELLKVEVTIVFNTSVPAGGHGVMDMHLECLRVYEDPPILRIAYVRGAEEHMHTVRLPIVASKFTEPIQSISAHDFFVRWKQLGGPNEVQRVIRSQRMLDRAQLQERLSQYGLGVQQGVDPNAGNIVAVGVMFAAAGNVAILLRIEPNWEQKMFRLTLRTTDITFSRALIAAVERFLLTGN